MNYETKEIKAEGLKMLDITIDGSRSEVEEFIKQHHDLGVPCFVHNKAISVKAIYDPLEVEKIKEVAKS